MTAETRTVVTHGIDPVTGKRVDNSLPAECYGPLAIHLTWECDGWAITHAESGYQVCSVAEYDAAVEIATHMANFDWRIPEPNRSIPGPLRVEVTSYLREAKKKWPTLQSAAFELKPIRP